MSKRPFVTQYSCPNIVIVPTVSFPPPKKPKLDVKIQAPSQQNVTKPELCVKPDYHYVQPPQLCKKSDEQYFLTPQLCASDQQCFQSSQQYVETSQLCERSVHCVQQTQNLIQNSPWATEINDNASLEAINTSDEPKISSEDFNKNHGSEQNQNLSQTTRKTSASWASNYLVSIGEVYRKQIKLNLSLSRKKETPKESEPLYTSTTKTVDFAASTPQHMKKVFLNPTEAVKNKILNHTFEANKLVNIVEPMKINIVNPLQTNEQKYRSKSLDEKSSHEHNPNIKLNIPSSKTKDNADFELKYGYKDDKYVTSLNVSKKTHIEDTVTDPDHKTFKLKYEPQYHNYALNKLYSGLYKSNDYEYQNSAESSTKYSKYILKDTDRSDIKYNNSFNSPDSSSSKLPRGYEDRYKYAHKAERDTSKPFYYEHIPDKYRWYKNQDKCFRSESHSRSEMSLSLSPPPFKDEDKSDKKSNKVRSPVKVFKPSRGSISHVDSKSKTATTIKKKTSSKMPKSNDSETKLKKDNKFKTVSGISKPDKNKPKTDNKTYIKSKTDYKSKTVDRKSETDNSRSKIDNSRSKIDNSKSKIDNSKSKIDNSKSKIDNSKSKTNNSKSKTDKTRPKTDINKSKTNNSKSKTDNKKVKANNSKSKKGSSEFKSISKAVNITPKSPIRPPSSSESDNDIDDHLNISNQSTPIKSMVQLKENIVLNKTASPQNSGDNFDLRAKLSRRNLDHYFTKLRNSKVKKPKAKRDHLVITVQNEPEDENLDSEQKTTPDDVTTKNVKVIKQINLVINVMCDKSAPSESETEDECNDKENETCHLNNPDLSFLDDFNIDEIVESLENCRNGPNSTNAEESDSQDVIIRSSTVSPISIDNDSVVEISEDEGDTLDIHDEDTMELMEIGEKEVGILDQQRSSVIEINDDTSNEEVENATHSMTNSLSAGILENYNTSRQKTSNSQLFGVKIVVPDEIVKGNVSATMLDERKEQIIEVLQSINTNAIKNPGRSQNSHSSQVNPGPSNVSSLITEIKTETNTDIDTTDEAALSGNNANGCKNSKTLQNSSPSSEESSGPLNVINLITDIKTEPNINIKDEAVFSRSVSNVIINPKTDSTKLVNVESRMITAKYIQVTIKTETIECESSTAHVNKPLQHSTNTYENKNPERPQNSSPSLEENTGLVKVVSLITDIKTESNTDIGTTNDTVMLGSNANVVSTPELQPAKSVNVDHRLATEKDSLQVTIKTETIECETSTAHGNKQVSNISNKNGCLNHSKLDKDMDIQSKGKLDKDIPVTIKLENLEVTNVSNNDSYNSTEVIAQNNDIVNTTACKLKPQSDLNVATCSIHETSAINVQNSDNCRDINTTGNVSDDSPKIKLEINSVDNNSSKTTPYSLSVETSEGISTEINTSNERDISAIKLDATSVTNTGETNSAMIIDDSSEANTSDNPNLPRIELENSPILNAEAIKIIKNTDETFNVNVRNNDTEGNTIDTSNDKPKITEVKLKTKPISNEEIPATGLITYNGLVNKITDIQSSNSTKTKDVDSTIKMNYEENVPKDGTVITTNSGSSEQKGELSKPDDKNSQKDATMNRKGPVKAVFALLEQRMLEYLKEEYTVTSIIHKGKFSNIYRCRNAKGKEYAAKVLKNKSDRYQMGIMKERMLMNLQRDIPLENFNCVSIVNGFGITGQWCLLMEYYPKTLEQVLAEREKPFHIDTVQELSRQLIGAVLVLRNNNLIHSDIKPSHILMNSTNDRLKLCGFDDSYYYTNHVDVLPCLGTVNYRAPEIILGYPADFRIDVWSTALVMYEMHTCRKLFPGLFNNDILYKHMCTLEDMPMDMIKRSFFSDNHFQGNTFMRRVGVHGQKIIPVPKFKRNIVLHSGVFKTHNLHWASERIKQKHQDNVKLKMFYKLLLRMLAMSPEKRMTIEFVYVNEFVLK